MTDYPGTQIWAYYDDRHGTIYKAFDRFFNTFDAARSYAIDVLEHGLHQKAVAVAGVLDWMPDDEL
jgi:hypothetical protein